MHPNLLTLTKRLCTIPSASSDIKELHNVIDLLVEEFSLYKNAIVQKVVFNEKPSLLVQNFEWKHANIVLNGHIDVVPPSSDEQFAPYEKDGKLFARWAWDMKAGVAIIVEIMKDVLDDPELDKKVTLMITSDEEIGGFDGVWVLVSKGYTGDVVLIPDGWAVDRVVYANKGIYMFTVEASGVACHSARPRLGENALHNIVNYFQVLRDELQDTYKVYQTNHHWWTSVNLNMLDGGIAMNAVPDIATAKIDIRFTEEYTADIIKKKVMSQMHSFNCRLLSELHGDVLYTDPKHPIFQQFIGVVKKVIGRKPELGKDHGGSDGRFFPTESVVIFQIIIL